MNSKNVGRRAFLFPLTLSYVALLLTLIVIPQKSFSKVVHGEPKLLCIVLLPDTSEKMLVDTAKVYYLVDRMPKFTYNGENGLNAFRNYVKDNIDHSFLLSSNASSTGITVSFIVEIDGSVSSIEILRGGNSLLNDEIIKVIKHAPKWVAGMQEGSFVRVKYTLHILWS